jgi:hypothetical protein
MPRYHRRIICTTLVHGVHFTIDIIFPKKYEKIILIKYQLILQKIGCRNSCFYQLILMDKLILKNYFLIKYGLGSEQITIYIVKIIIQFCFYIKLFFKIPAKYLGFFFISN